MAQDTARTTQHTAWAHRQMGGKWPRTPHTHSNALSGHVSEQEPRGPGPRTTKAKDRVGTPVNRSQVARDTARTTQHTPRAHGRTGAKWPRTPQPQSNAPSGHTGEQESSGPGHHTSKARDGTGTSVNRSQVAGDTAHATQQTTRAHR